MIFMKLLCWLGWHRFTQWRAHWVSEHKVVSGTTALAISVYRCCPVCQCVEEQMVMEHEVYGPLKIEVTGYQRNLHLVKRRKHG